AGAVFLKEPNGVSRRSPASFSSTPNRPTTNRVTGIRQTPQRRGSLLSLLFRRRAAMSDNFRDIETGSSSSWFLPDNLAEQYSEAIRSYLQALLKDEDDVSEVNQRLMARIFAGEFSN